MNSTQRTILRVFLATLGLPVACIIWGTIGGIVGFISGVVHLIERIDVIAVGDDDRPTMFNIGECFLVMTVCFWGPFVGWYRYVFKKRSFLLTDDRLVFQPILD